MIKMKEMTTEKAREIVKYPLLSEKAMNAIELENKLVFIVKQNTNKKQIKKAIEKLYEVEVEDVKTLNTMKNEKKAFIKLKPDHNAMDLATDLQLI